MSLIRLYYPCHTKQLLHRYHTKTASRRLPSAFCWFSIGLFPCSRSRFFGRLFRLPVSFPNPYCPILRPRSKSLPGRTESNGVDRAVVPLGASHHFPALEVEEAHPHVLPSSYKLLAGWAVGRALHGGGQGVGLLLGEGGCV